jgi:hypothetical protein
MFKEIAEHFKGVIKKSEDYNNPRPCNNIDLLFPPFYKLIKQLISDYMYVHESEPYILETYRSNDLQQLYFNRGASKIRKNGMHHYGIAVDLVAKDENGDINYSILDYSWIRKRAKELGLYMLDWEDAHIQAIPVSLQNALRNECL